MRHPEHALALRELRLRDFRNFAALDLEFPPGGAAVIGDNGSGKTNLLEAVYYLEIFRSFRGAADDQLVRFGADSFFIRGVFEEVRSGERHEVSAGYERRTRTKRVALDGVEPERLGDALGGLGAVVFSPSDVALVAGAPGERRRFLDIVLSLNARGYFDALQRYRGALRQRNATLKAGTGSAHLAAWDAALVAGGARVIAERMRWVAEHAAAFGERFAAIGAGGTAELAYEGSVRLPAEPGAASVDAAAAAFTAELARVAERERERGMTLVGPHRDDLAIRFGGTEEGVGLREFGSGGQQRTAAIALRMIEAETIRAARDREPVVLLDDVFAELDPGRSRRILALMEEEERGQVLLTAPKESDVELRGGSLARWRIAAGRIET
ncbi:MAG: DNA replication and repair protein RecF [Gemmatimonadota bacterium]